MPRAKSRHRFNRPNCCTINNVLQENAIKGGQTAWGRDAHGKQRRTTSREVGAIDQDVKINRALWHLATEMAKLKGVYA